MKQAGWLLFGTVLGCAGTAPAGSGPERPGPLGEDAVAEVTQPDGPAGFHYPAIENQSFSYHRFDSLITIHPGGATQVQTFGRTAYLRVSLHDTTVAAGSDTAMADSASGEMSALTRAIVAVILDSISQDPRSTMRQPALDSVRGASWRILIAPNGGVGLITMGQISSVGENLSGELARLLFPPLPTSGAAIGSQWRDSSENRIAGFSVPQTERAVTTFHVPEQDLASATALRIEGRAQLQRSGRDEQAGRTIELEGTGVDSTTWLLGAGGRFVGAEGADSVALTFNIPEVGQSVPVIQVGRYWLRELVASSEPEPEPAPAP